ncbi:peptidoglycan-binding domain-containing protein [uncultured Pseudomonas sp.]|uniref:peptidoglycan-binding domain-containing protein n=1 Tax=uncultured Pseudomonas sp. TaxID=114707 RepID=UPI00261F5E79|nr:peptidoglycan-binding domain-containing protein [uncultured Pseudomonas sp.]
MKPGFILIPTLLMGLMGCASQSQPDATNKDDVYLNAWTKERKAKNALIIRPASVAQTAEPAVTPEPTMAAAPMQSSQAAGSESMISANQCWVQSIVRPKPIQQPIDVLVKDAVNTIEVSQAQLSQDSKRVVSKEGVTMYTVEPPVYDAVTERVEVRPKIVRKVVIPAVFKEQMETVEVEAARTELEVCKAAGVQFAQTTSARTLCARLIPAVTTTVTQMKLVKPETIQEIVEPAVYKEVTRWKLITPARVVEVKIPDENIDVPVQLISQPATQEEKQLPAESQQMLTTVYDGAPQMVTVRAVCQDELNQPMITSLQNALNGAGVNPGPVDGTLGPKTVAALMEYQHKNGLAYGALTYESLEHLNVQP